MMKRTITARTLGLVGAAMLAVGPAMAQQYWDVNGAGTGATGSGDGSAPGNWTDNNWTPTSDPTGASATVAWGQSGNKHAVFSAGVNATGTFTVTLPADVDVNNLQVEEGHVTISGPGMLRYNMANNSVWGAAAGSSLVVACPVLLTNITASQALRLSTPSSTTTVSGAISGTIGGISAENGTTILTGTNTFDAPVFLNYTPVLCVNSIKNVVVGGPGLPSALGAPTSVANGTITFQSNAGTLKYIGAGDSTDRPLQYTAVTDLLGYGVYLEQAGTGPLVFNGDFTPSSGRNVSLFLAGSPASPGVATAEYHGNIINPTGTVKILELRKQGAGVWTLSGTNTYAGKTYVHAGTLRVISPGAIPGGLDVSGGTNNIDVQGGVLELGYGDFSRALGAGATQAQFGAGSGFSAYGASRIVNLGGAGATYYRGQIPSPLVFGSPTANARIEFKNGIDFNSGAMTIRVDDNPDSMSDQALVSGALVGYGGLIKTGTGTLILSASNNYDAATTISTGVLVAAHAYALSTKAIGVSSNATFAVATNTIFTRAVTFANGAALAGAGTFTTNNWTTPAGLVLKPGLPAGTLTVDVGGSTRTNKFGTNTVLQIAIQPDGTYGKLAVNGALDISDPTARLVVSGPTPASAIVLAEGTALVGQFQPGNVNLSGLTGVGASEAVVRYSATQVILVRSANGLMLSIQ